MRLYLVRHGETLWNEENRFQGWADQPLSPTGEEQARTAAALLAPVAFGAAYCSDLQRAIRTAEIILEGRGLEPVQLEGLREMNIGELDGLTVSEIERRFPELLKAWREDPLSVKMPGGETLEEVSERCRAALDPLVERHRDENVLVVAHHTVNKAILFRLLGIPLRHFRTLRQPPCAVSVVDFHDSGVFIRAVNLNWSDSGHDWIDLDAATRQRLRGAEGVAFDLDGVLLDSMPFYAAAWRSALAEWGVVPPEIEFYRHESEDAVRSVRYFFDRAGIAVEDETVKAVIERVRKIYGGYSSVRAVPGAFGIVDRIKQAGKGVALVTGSPRADVEKLLTQGEIELFNVIVTGDDVSCGKPDPQPYARAQEQLGIERERLVAVENAPLGIRSARCAGLLTVALTSTLPPGELSDADVIINSLKRLTDYLGVY